MVDWKEQYLSPIVNVVNYLDPDPIRPMGYKKNLKLNILQLGNMKSS